MKLIVILGALFLSAFGQESNLGPDNQTTTPFETTILPESPDLGNNTIDPAIVRGQRAQPGEIPWHAFLVEYTPKDPAICGGSLIHPLWIFTAAHCIETPNSYTVVSMGSTNINQMTYRQRATHRILHPQYNPNGRGVNDVGLLRLPTPASGPGIAVIPLVPDGVGNLNGVSMQASGFGYVRFAGPHSPDLLKATLRGISNMECANTFPFVIPSVLCVRGDNVFGQSVCMGDSGGPLVATVNNRPMLAGLVSFGAGEERGGCDTAPQAFSRVTSFRAWAENTMARYG